MRTERRSDDRFVVEQDPRANLEVRVALRLLEKHRDAPAVLRCLDLFVIPVSAFDEAHGEPSAAPPAPFDQVAQVAFGVAQICLDDDARMRPVLEFRLRKKRPEKLESSVLMR